MAGIHFDITGDNSNFLRRLQEVENGVKNTSKQIEQSGLGIEELFNRMTKAAAAFGAGFTAKELISNIVQVRGEFQQLEVAFNTMLGSSEKANVLMQQLVKTAATTPFDLQGVANGAKQLLAYGEDVEKVNDDLIRLGNIAAGLSQPLGDIVYLYGTTMTQGRLYTQDLNQFTGRGIPMIRELANQFGVAENEVKGLVEAGKVGFPEVQKVIMSLTDEGGMFFNLMQEQSKTITGQISNIEDAIATMFNEIGKANEGIINDALSGVSYLVENYEKIGNILLEIVGTYGVYKSALMVTTALQSVQASGITALTAKEAIHYGWLVLTKKAQDALNLSMLKNPYVLAAAAIAGLTYGIYKLVTAETASEKAVRKHREEQERFQKTIDERKSKIEDLIRIIQDETETEYAQIKAYEELQKLSPALTESYSREQLATLQLAESQKVLNRERDNMDYDNIIKNINRIKNSIENYKKAIDASAKLPNSGTAVSSFYNKIAVSEKELEKWEESLREYNRLKKEAEEESKPVEVKLLEAKSNREQIIQEYNAAKLALKQEQEKLAESSFSVIPIDVQIRFNKAKEELNNIDNAISKLENKRSNTNKMYAQAYKEAKDNWKAKTKAVQEAKKKSEEEYKKAVKEQEEAEKAYKDLGGVTGSSLTKQENQAKKQLEQQEQLAEQLLSLRRKNQQDEINLMEEGTEKKLAQIKADFESQKQAVEKQAKELAKANKEAGVANLNKNGLTQEQQEEINKTVALNVQSMNRSITDLYKSPIEQYQSYTDERIAIEKKFNDDIALLQEARRKAEENGDADEIAKIDRSIAKATAEKGKSLMKHDFDVLKQSPEYIRAFEDLKNTSSETLNSLLNQLEKAKQTAAETLNPEDLREYTTTIQEIIDELDARNPFQALADRQKELAEAEKELAEAKRQLDAVNRGERIVTGVKTSLGEDGKIKIENTYLSAADALNKYNAAKDKHQIANNNFIKAEKTAREKVDELAVAIKGVGDAIGGQAGEIISLMGDVALFATGTIDGITKVTQTGANAISAVEKASVILGIISTAIQLLQKIGELGSNKAFSQYEAYAEKVKEINALTDAVNEYRIAALEAQQAEANWFSVDNLRNLRDYKDLHDEVAKAYADKAMEAQAIYQNKSGGGWLTGAFNWVMGNMSLLSWSDKWKNIWGQGNYDKGMTAAINNLRIETRKKSSGFLGTGIGGKSQKTEDLVAWARNQGLGELFDDDRMINKELAQSLIDNYGNKLVGQTKETLEALIELREQYDEYLNQLHEYVSSLYAPLVDNFVDSLWDWLDNGKDALDSFKDYASSTFRDIVSDMMRTIVLDKVVGTFSDDIAALYEEYANGAIDETELMKKISERTSGLIDNYEQNIPTLQNIMNEINGYLQESGIDLKKSESTSQQKATYGGFETMSQDTASELNGRFTALQIAGEEIKNQMQNAAEGINILIAISTDGNTIMNSILSQHVMTNGYLEDIVKYTKPMLDFGSKFDKMISIFNDKL